MNAILREDSNTKPARTQEKKQEKSQSTTR